MCYIKKTLLCPHVLHLCFLSFYLMNNITGTQNINRDVYFESLNLNCKNVLPNRKKNIFWI